MIKRIIPIILLYICFGQTEVRATESLPTEHWSYEFIDQLRIAGYFTDLSPTTKPYTRQQIAESLVEIGAEIRSGWKNPSPHEEWMLAKLAQEFEIDRRIITEDIDDHIHYGIWADGNIETMNGDVDFVPAIKSVFAISPFKDITIGASGKFDKSLLDDPGYYGYIWRGLAVFTEQAYVRWKYKAFDFVFGRDFTKWGPGKTGQLLISDVARPMDQLGFRLRYGPLRFSYLAARLEPYSLPDTLSVSGLPVQAKRYLSAHRLDFSIKDKCYIGLSEILLYGGINEGAELQYLNPFLYYHAELLNRGGSDGNGILGVDIAFYPARNWQIYGELIVDDIQVERTGNQDLEPAEYAFLAGVYNTQLLGQDGLKFGVEYVRVANRTYNSPHLWEKYLHRNDPIGHQLGNDFDLWNIAIQKWFSNGWKVVAGLDVLRNGQGTIKLSWDTPWMFVNDGESYTEPFPSGIVERKISPYIEIKYFFNTSVQFEWLSSINFYNNYEHIAENEANTWEMKLKMWLCLDNMILNVNK